MKINNILISIVVLTYNSEKTILKTLDSIFDQTYDNVELVISDDDSKDNTVNIVRKWIDEKKYRFYRALILENEHNVGVSENSNRAIEKTEGKWILLFAGDDLLYPDFIKSNINRVYEQPENKIFQTQQSIINENDEVISTSAIEHYKMKELVKMSVEEQYQYLLYNDIKLSASMFFKKDIFMKIGGCDTKIRNIEDYPLKLKFLKNGFRMGYVDKVLVKYRIHDSVSHDLGCVYSIEHLNQRKKLKEQYCYPYIKKRRIRYFVSEKLDDFQIWCIVRLFANRNTVGSRIFKKMMYILNPRKWDYLYLKLKYWKLE